MDVSGRGASTRQRENDRERESERQCEECKEAGQMVDASGFCKDCNDFLCHECIEQHKKLRATRHHALMEGVETPQLTPDKPVVNMCPEHQKPLELYCQSDDAFGCYLCMPLLHKACLNVGYIPKLSKNVESSQELREIREVSQQHRNLVAFYQRCIQKYQSSNTDDYEQSLKDFQAFRGEIEEMLNKRGQTITTQTARVHQENKAKLDHLSGQIASLGEKMESVVSEIEDMKEKKHLDALFIAVKSNRKAIEEASQKLEKLGSDIEIQQYKFQANRIMKDLLEHETMIGEIKVFAMVNKRTSGEIIVKAPEDGKNCWISGIAEISPNELVVTDYNNHCVKKLEVDTDTPAGWFPLSSAPIDVAVLPGSKVAVTLPKQQQIQTFSTDKGLIPCKSIDVDGQCLAIACTDDRLIVSFCDPGKVEILDMNGMRLHCFETDEPGEPLFRVPHSLSLDHNCIYISDSNKKTVTCLSTKGAVEWLYRDDELKHPLGMSVGADGSLYICCNTTHTIHVVSAEGAKQHVIALEEFNLKNPKAVCVSRYHKLMYVSNYSSEPTQRRKTIGYIPLLV